MVLQLRPPAGTWQTTKKRRGRAQAEEKARGSCSRRPRTRERKPGKGKGSKKSTELRERRTEDAEENQDYTDFHYTWMKCAPFKAEALCRTPALQTTPTGWPYRDPKPVIVGVYVDNLNFKPVGQQCIYAFAIILLWLAFNKGLPWSMFQCLPAFSGWLLACIFRLIACLHFQADYLLACDQGLAVVCLEFYKGLPWSMFQCLPAFSGWLLACLWPGSCRMINVSVLACIFRLITCLPVTRVLPYDQCFSACLHFQANYLPVTRVLP